MPPLPRPYYRPINKNSEFTNLIEGRLRKKIWKTVIPVDLHYPQDKQMMNRRLSYGPGRKKNVDFLE